MNIEDNIALIEARIVELANRSENNWEISQHLPRIAKAKYKFFGLDGWNRCPCYPPDDTIHGCGTEACGKEITETGKCHCNLYLRK